MKVTTHIVFWLGLILVMSILVPGLMGPDASYARVRAEHDAAVRVFGAGNTDVMTKRANGVHDVLIVQSGLQRILDRGFTTNKQLKEQEIAVETQTRFSVLFNRYLQTVSTEVYGLVFRGCIMLHWLAYIGIFLVAAVADGICQRRVKLATAKSLSPLRYTIALHLMVVIAFSPLVYLLAPFNVTPWFMPVWVIVISYPLAKAISNIVGLD
jgi:Domain of unknown function (DUF4400)